MSAIASFSKWHEAIASDVCLRRIVKASQHICLRLLMAISPTPHPLVRAAWQVKVDDISGGCGSMYSIAIESPVFKGMSLVKQHQLVKSTLKKEIAAMHGLTLQTKVSANA
jgi:stress-induced morphogen